MSDEKKVDDTSKGTEKNKHHDRYKVKTKNFNNIFIKILLEPPMGQQRASRKRTSR
jgi:hypothetical protein